MHILSTTLFVNFHVQISHKVDHSDVFMKQTKCICPYIQRYVIPVTNGCTYRKIIYTPVMRANCNGTTTIRNSVGGYATSNLHNQ